MLSKDISDALDLLDQDAAPEIVGEHGRVVERRQEAYHDVIVYEDGYEESYYIGD